MGLPWERLKKLGSWGWQPGTLRLRVYLPLRSKLPPERMANQRKELSSIAYTMAARPMPVRVEAMFLCVLRKLLIPTRQS